MFYTPAKLCLDCDEEGEVLKLHAPAEDSEGEPINEERLFCFRQNLRVPLIHLWRQGWRVDSIRIVTSQTVPDLCALTACGPPEKPRLVTKIIAALFHWELELFREAEVFPLNERGYGWLRPCSYGAARLERMQLVTRPSEIRSLEEPIVQCSSDGEALRLECCCADQHTRSLRYDEFIARPLRGQRHDIPQGALWFYRVRFVGRACQWPDRNERAGLVAEHGRDAWLVQACSVNDDLKCELMPVNGVTLDSVHPLTYYNLSRG
jgi:hypothetical protein